MSEQEDRPVIIRRIKRIKKGGHHGGSWKIAYADFVTAMMAFFLLMWLLGLLNKYQLAGIAEYFKKPAKEAFQHDPHLKGVAKNTERYTEKNKEKEKEKEKEKFKEKQQQKSTNQMVITPGDQSNNGTADKPTYVLVNPYQNKNKPQVGLAQQVMKISAEDLKSELEQKLEQNPELREFKNQLNFQVTADGLKIRLGDLENKTMFTKGKSDFQEYSKKIIAWLSHELNNYQNNVVIIGHTDAAAYDNINYTNWELSADRANATRRELIKNGMGPTKIVRIIGMGDTDLLDKKNGLNPANRRIEILVLTSEAMKKLQH